MLKIILSIGAIQIVAIAIQFIRSKLVAVFLGPTGVGVTSTIDQTVQFAAFVAALSIPLASVKFLSKAHSEGHEAFKRCYAGFLHLLVLLSVTGLLFAGGLVFLRPQIFGAEIEKYQSFLLIALISLPALVLGGFFSNVFASAQNYRASAGLAVFTNAITTAAIITGILTAGILGLYVGSSLASVALTIGIIVFLWKKWDLPFFTDGWKALKDLWQSPNVISFTAMLYLGSVSYSLSMLVARYAILSNFGEADTGLLQGALILSIAIGMILNPANGLYLMPMMNRDIERTEKIHHAIEFQRKLVIILSLIALPVVMFPQLMLSIMFSTKFVSVGHLVYLFIFAQFVTQMAGVHQAVLIGLDDLKAYTLIVTGGQLGFALISWILAPQFGIMGVAAGAIGSSLSIFVFTLIRLRLRHGFPVPRNLVLLILYSLSILVLTGWVSAHFNEWDISSAGLKAAFFCLFATTLLVFLSSKERSDIYGFRQKLSFGR